MIQVREPDRIAGIPAYRIIDEYRNNAGMIRLKTERASAAASRTAGSSSSRLATSIDATSSARKHSGYLHTARTHRLGFPHSDIVLENENAGSSEEPKSCRNIVAIPWLPAFVSFLACLQAPESLPLAARHTRGCFAPSDHEQWHTDCLRPPPEHSDVGVSRHASRP